MSTTGIGTRDEIAKEVFVKAMGNLFTKSLPEGIQFEDLKDVGRAMVEMAAKNSFHVANIFMNELECQSKES